MRENLVEIAMSQKVGAITAASSILTWAASVWGWVDVNMIKLSSAAAFVLTIVLIIAHICATLRQNREHKSEMRKRELEIELLKRQLGEEND